MGQPPWSCECPAAAAGHAYAGAVYTVPAGCAGCREGREGRAHDPPEDGKESYQIIFRAAMAKSGEKADCIYRTLVQGLSSHISEKEAAAILEHLTDPAICKVFELSRRVWHEAHHYMGFVRFSELKNGVLFSEIEAENQVLPLLADHFANRLPNEDFLIYDRAHDLCLLHRRQRPCVLVRDVRPDTSFSDREEEIQQLWLGFCRSISIEARENQALQQQMLPLRFRKWMTEERNFTG